MYSIDDTDDMGINAPTPLDTASINKGDFAQLSNGQGAKSARHAKPAGHKAETGMPRRMMVILSVAALLVIVLGVALFVRVLNTPVAANTQQQVMRTQAGVNQSVTYSGSTYSLREENGKYSLVESHADGDKKEVVVGGLPGTPVSIVLFDGAVLLPENLPDGTWDVSVYTVGVGWSTVGSRNGTPSSGQGTISEANLDGSKLLLTVDGSTVEVPLVW